ncbi:Protein Y53G8AR.7 a [Aphelenchoides avenae]|nr:Protein Y53G8AR.7 a [Aphelenchus avenae]
MWLMFAGNTIYLSVETLSARRRLVLLIGRFITGLGSSNISLLKAYASTASTTKDRSRAIAFVTGGVALGMTTGPALQLIFTPIGYPGFFLTKTLSISMYTAPAYAACIMNVLGSLAIHFLFKEHYAGVVNKDIKANGGKKVPIPKFDPVAVALCHLTRFTQMFTHTNIETLGSPVAMVMFSWTRKEAVEYISTAQGFMSFLAFLTYIVYIVFKLDRVLNFRVNCIISLIGLVVFHLLTFSWPFLPGKVQTYVEGDNVTYASDQELLGCNVEKFSWCETLKPVNVWVYYGSYIVLIGLSFPNMNIALNTLFSKILGPRRQGTQQGILQCLVVAHECWDPSFSLYMAYGPRMAWIVEILVIVATLVLWVVFYDRMVPLEVSNLGQISPARTNNNSDDECSEQASDEDAVCPRVKTAA